MSLESAGFIPGLVATNPEGTDPKSQGDDHIRMLKQVLKNQFPSFLGVAVTKTEAQLNSALNQGDFGLGSMPGGPGLDALDANAITATGFYSLRSPFLNGPTAAPHVILHFSYDSNPGQLAIRAGNVDADIWIRTFNGSWSAWRKIWADDDLVKQTSQLDNDTSHVQMVGGFGLGGRLDLRGTIFETGSPSYFFGFGTLFGFSDGGPGGLAIPGLTGFVGGVLTLNSHHTDETGGGATNRTFTTGSVTYSQIAVSPSAWGPWLKHEIVTSELLVGSSGYRSTAGLVDQWGQTAAIPDDGAIVITFPLAMSEVFSVVATPLASFIGTSFCCPGVTNITTTGFTLYNMTNQTSAVPFKWMAKGRP